MQQPMIDSRAEGAGLIGGTALDIFNDSMLLGTDLEDDCCSVRLICLVWRMTR